MQHSDCEECQRLRIDRDAATIMYVRLNGELQTAKLEGDLVLDRLKTLRSRLRVAIRTLTGLQQAIREHNGKAHPIGFARQSAL
jgi:hypothetical protein